MRFALAAVTRDDASSDPPTASKAPGGRYSANSGVLHLRRSASRPAHGGSPKRVIDATWALPDDRASSGLPRPPRRCVTRAPVRSPHGSAGHCPCRRIPGHSAPPSPHRILERAIGRACERARSGARWSGGATASDTQFVSLRALPPAASPSCRVRTCVYSCVRA